MTIAPADLNLDALLNKIAELADLPDGLYHLAEAEYISIGNHLSSMAPDGWEIYPQGSMAIGTVVRPLTREGFDIDMVCLRHVAKNSTSQDKLKKEVGDALRGYVNATKTKPKGMEESGRCWVVEYPNVGQLGHLHLDVLPAITDAIATSPTAIEITDKDLPNWLPSNPRAYAAWFNLKTAEVRLAMRTSESVRLSKSVAEIPDPPVTTLQRVVQVLKLHRDHYFADEPDLRPPSIILTTLVALAYGGENQLADAVIGCVAAMSEHVTQSGGIYAVQSPVSDENFADKWRQHPERQAAFFDWKDRVAKDIETAGSSEGLDNVLQSLIGGFGEGRIVKLAKVLGFETTQSRVDGKLGFLSGLAGGLVATTRTGAKPPVQHNFYGQEES